jgi:glyceraldehyde 3-phosphate dehydrogenase
MEETNMTVKIGINGFGRIGRNMLRCCLEKQGVEVVAINDLTNVQALAHLLKYDSNFGRLNASVTFEESVEDGKPGSITVNGKKIAVYKCKDPKEIPWAEAGAQIVVESTGLFRKRAQAAVHLGDTVKKVIVSAPGDGKDPVDATIVLGVNDEIYDPKSHHVISNASCTTNCLAPVAKVLADNFGIVHGLMCTIHSYTNDQRILDLAHKDLRRARAAALSIIPSSTGAAKAIGDVIPSLKGKMKGYALRVPTPTVSVVDLTVVTSKPCAIDEVNAAMKKAADGPMKGYLEYCDEELVSIDFKGSHMSSSFDATLTDVIDGTLVKVVSWYDNEMGYSARMVDLCAIMGKSL